MRGGTTGKAGTMALTLALLCPALAWPQPAQRGNEVYTCTDRHGRRITSDRPIAECADREQRVLDHTGTERRRIGPTLTENERAERERQQRERARELARLAEQRHRERVLVARYPDALAHQQERQAALEQVNAVIEVATRRITQLRAERRKLDSELEFYPDGLTQAPDKLRRAYADNDRDTAEQQRFIATQEQEKQRINERFDAELAGLRRLWAERSGEPASPTEGSGR